MALADLLVPGPTRLMGVVNATPDSFAEPPAAGQTATSAIDRGLDLAEQGADLIDVGGESTRPGAGRVDLADELARVVPVVAALAGVGLTVSVDTTRAAVAAAAIEAGAVIVNDVSGGLADPAMYATVARSGAGYIAQHWRVPFDHRPTPAPAGDAAGPPDDIVAAVCRELTQRVEAALAAGIPADHLMIDPGLGFGKDVAQNWALVTAADRIATLGWPVLWGVSRKRFLAPAHPDATEPWQRDTAGAVVTGWLAQRRVWAVRVHQISVHRTAVAVAEAIRTGRPT